MSWQPGSESIAYQLGALISVTQDAAGGTPPDRSKSGENESSKGGAPDLSAGEAPARPAPPIAPQAVPNAVLESIRAEKAKLKAGSAEGTPKTMLDPQAVREALARATKEKEIRITAEIKAKANEPQKPFQPIENYKTATACVAVWDGTDSKDRCRYCPTCKLQVYDFSGLELPEAEELILKREDRKNATLYKRADGKFLTADCPVGVKAKQDRLMAIIGGTVLAVGLLLLLMMLPKPAPREATQPSEGLDSGGTASRFSGRTAGGNTPTGRQAVQMPAQRSVPVRNADGGFTWSSYVNQAKSTNTPKASEGLTPLTPTPASQTATQLPKDAPQPASPLPAQPAAPPGQPATSAPAASSPESNSSNGLDGSDASSQSKGVTYFGR